MKAIGLDIGTTTLSAIVMDGDDGRVIETINVANGANMAPDVPGARLQDPDQILKSVRALLQALTGRHGPVDVIGIDGQMHGILYVNAHGRAVSPLYTWQDGRGDQMLDGASYARRLSEKTGMAMATGLGLTTHDWLMKNGGLPEGARAMCTIADYVAMGLTGSVQVRMHASNAASLGLYDVSGGHWHESALACAGIDREILPMVTDRCELLGETAGGIPVACAIGDNQASFIGSVRNSKDAILVNMGTGGQISISAGPIAPFGDIECRPLNGKQCLWVGASLCGGRAYALLEGFVRSCASAMGDTAADVYEIMNGVGLTALDAGNPWQVDTRFSGTRRHPALRGSIGGIGVDNFDFEHLVGGVLMGMAGELWSHYEDMQAMDNRPRNLLVGSGNAIRRNPALKKAFEKVFGLEMQIPEHVEEAACGAALFALVAGKKKESFEAAQSLIRYVKM